MAPRRAAEGLALIDRERVHIVMSDQRMPEMSGVEFLCRVKETHPDTVRLLFTAYSDLAAVIDAINEGNVYRYISKPWEVDELRATLKQAYEHYQLQEERRELLVQVQQKNAQLEAANAELRRANDLKKAFIKVASHELRTPLTVLLGLAEQLSEMTVSEPRLHSCSERMQRAGQRLHERVDQMVKLLLAGRFERPLQRRATPMPPLIHAALAEVRDFTQMRQQTLDAAVPDDLGQLDIEPDKIQDSLVQLLLNAIKFTPNGGDDSPERTADSMDGCEFPSGTLAWGSSRTICRASSSRSSPGSTSRGIPPALSNLTSAGSAWG